MTKVFFIDRRGRVRGRVRAGERVAPTNTIAKPPQSCQELELKTCVQRFPEAVSLVSADRAGTARRAGD